MPETTTSPDPSAGTVLVRDVDKADAAAIADIYNPYVADSIITFEEEAVSEIEMAQRISETVSQKLPWILAEEGGRVLGYAYASKWKGRCAYRFAVEVTVYLARGVERRGVGSRLYAELLERLRGMGMHAAMGGIALPNPASVALHEKFGFRKVAHFVEVGYKLDRWIDVGYWQLVLDGDADQPPEIAPIT